MELGEWYNPPFVRVVEAKDWQSHTHSVSTGVQNFLMRRDDGEGLLETATMQNLLGGAYYLAGGAD